ncbi:MAG: LTA synthase family protein, partial [Gammaproteobacteria bacterium]|nr:LTA synthase family protein [Gammaproteobacteria bacterium]
TADTTLAEMGVKRLPLSMALQESTGIDAAEDNTPFTKRPRNVVLISVESLSASFLGAYGATTGLTPHLDQLAREGLKFERVFATGTRTVRGLEALSLGTPPVPGQAIVRRPNNEHLTTIGELLEYQGFSTFFFYGGYGYFDNMNAYFGANDYRVIDRTDFPKQTVIFENAWGVADEVLFDNTLAALDRESGKDQPFFAQIMTTSNHRPYTYPDGRIDIPSPGGREGAVKYTDYAIGKFINDARAKPWFNDTLFVIVADHCAAVAGKSKLPVENYHIPLIFYAPALLKPGSYAPMVSQIDIAPTLIEVLGKKGDDYFFGRPFFETGNNPERVFISNYQELGYLSQGVLTVLLPQRRVESFRIDPETYAATPAAVDPQRLNEAIAYYQTASRAFKGGNLRAPDHSIAN